MDNKDQLNSLIDSFTADKVENDNTPNNDLINSFAATTNQENETIVNNQIKEYEKVVKPTTTTPIENNVIEQEETKKEETVVQEETTQVQQQTVQTQEQTIQQDNNEQENISTNQNKLGQVPTKSNLEIDFGDSLLRAYVGKHYERISRRTINFAAFFFGPLYLLYRKSFLYGVLIISVISCLFAVFVDYQLYVAIGAGVINLIVTFMFNKKYMAKANKKIYNLKLNNLHASQEELQLMAANEGGTAFLNIFAGLVTTSILILGFNIILNKFDISMYNNLFNNYKYEGLLIYDDDINVEESFVINIPNVFKKEKSMGLYEYSYTEKKKKDSKDCKVSFNALDKFVDAKRLINQMREFNKLDNPTEVVKKEIEGTTWYGYSFNNVFGEHYYYAAKVDDHVYLYNFEILDEKNENCKMYADGILQSIKEKSKVVNEKEE